MKINSYITFSIAYITVTSAIIGPYPALALSWNGEYTLKDLELTGTDFMDQEVPYWNISSCFSAACSKYYNCAENYLLGGYKVLGGTKNQYFERIYSDLPAHNQIDMQITFYPLDSWDGTLTDDHFEIYFDGNLYYAWRMDYQVSYATSICGNPIYNELPPIRATIHIPHNSSTLTFRVINQLDENSENESIGFRDIVMNFTVASIPSYSLCGVVNTGQLPNQVCPCATGQYMNPASTGLCVNCYTNCSACTGTGSTQCTGCVDGRYLRNGACYACHPSCSTCDGPLDTDCLTCPSTYFMVESSCTPYCPLPFYPTSNNVCQTTCPGQFIYKDGTCSTTCDSPYSPYYTLSLKACICYNEVPGGDCYSCDSSCFTCQGQASTQCQTCNDRFYFTEIDTVNNTGTCSDCNSACLTCTGPSADQCLTCDPNKFFVASSENTIIGSCQSCNDSCVTCSGPQSNQCLTCETNQYLSSDNTCSPCDDSCATCDGPTANNCVSCDSGFYLVDNDTCVSSCPSPFFVTSNGRKDFCETSCTRASTPFAFLSGFCKSGCDTRYSTQIISPTLKACYCNDNFEYWNQSCLATCNSPLSSRIEGTRKFCDFPCPQDAFLNDNGTCTTSCVFPYTGEDIGEQNNKYCHDLGCETMRIKYIKSTTNGYQYRIQFTPASCDFEPSYIQSLLNTNDIAIALLHDFTFTVTRITGNLYQVDLSLPQSVLQDSTLDFTFSSLSAQMVVFTKFIPSEFAEQLVAYAQKAQTSVIIATGIALATALFLQATASVWGFVGFQQLINYLKYINVAYPYQMEILFVLGGSTSFGSLPNLIDTWTQDEYSRYAVNDDLVDYQAPPSKFNYYGETSYFTKNGGSIVLMNGIVLILVILLILLMKIQKIRQNSIMTKIDTAIRWNFHLRILMTTFLPLTVAICLQYRTMTFEGGYLAICSTLTIISTVYAVIVCVAMIKILYSKTPDQLNQKEFQDTYGTLVKGVSFKTKSAKYYYMLIMLRGILVSILIVFAEAMPLLQIFSLVLFNIFFVYYLSTQVSFANPKEAAKTLTTETLLIPTISLISLLNFSRKSEAYYQVVGWVLVGMVGVIFINEFIFLVTIYYEAIKKAIAKIKEMLQKKPSAKLDPKSPSRLETKASGSALNLLTTIGPTIVDMTSAAAQDQTIFTSSPERPKRIQSKNKEQLSITNLDQSLPSDRDNLGMNQFVDPRAGDNLSVLEEKISVINDANDDLWLSTNRELLPAIIPALDRKNSSLSIKPTEFARGNSSPKVRSLSSPLVVQINNRFKLKLKPQVEPPLQVDDLDTSPTNQPVNNPTLGLNNQNSVLE